MIADTPRTLFSESLNLSLKWKVDVDLDVRLLRPYLPDGTPITTSIEIEQLHGEEKQLREIAEAKVEEHEEKIREQAAELEKLRQQLSK